MDSMRPGITGFILARVAEDEAVARRVPDIPNAYRVVSSDPDAADPGLAAQHYIRNNPARVLAECAAKRQIVELHDGSHECSTYDHNGEVDNCTWCLNAEDCSTMRLLAAIWADHPDYREEWR